VDEGTKKFVLRMIPYGVHVLTSIDSNGAPVAATLHWVMQTSFDPPLVTVALPAGSAIYAAVRGSQRFALHMLGKDDGAEAFAFQTRPAVVEEKTLSGWGFAYSGSGLPLLHDAPAVLECTVRGVMEYGDHHPVMAEITEVYMRLPQQDRPDKMILHLMEMGETIFYGG
jgi:flavin reductase (DIM6/NTAB) family NADH-FMN oxidoreductase RutF